MKRSAKVISFVMAGSVCRQVTVDQTSLCVLPTGTPIPRVPASSTVTCPFRAL
jgi:hypothetical protein